MFAPRFRDNPLVLLVVRVTLEKTSVLASSFDLFVLHLKPFDLSFQEFLGKCCQASEVCWILVGLPFTHLNPAGGLGRHIWNRVVPVQLSERSVFP